MAYPSKRMGRPTINVVGRRIATAVVATWEVNSEKLLVTMQKMARQSSKRYPRWHVLKLIVRIDNQLCFSRHHRVPGVVSAKPFPV
jgi:hypothetical protein